MTAEFFAKKAAFKVVCMPDPDKEVVGAYVGDLLSWVMGKANSGDVWITIMSNVNILAVATLADTSCILLAENTQIDDDIKKTAEEKGINILSTELSAYQAAIKVSESIC